MAFSVVAPFFAALFAPFVTQGLGYRAGWVLALVPALLFAFFASMIPEVRDGAPLIFSHVWVPAYNVTFSFLMDGLSLTFALLITGIGTFILIYAGGYLKGHEHHGRFFAFLLLFMGSMLGLVTANNLITLFIFWELTSITSFLLIGFDHKREASRRAALQALIITGGGGLSLLAGIVLIGTTFDTWEMHEILAAGNIGDHPMYLPILLLLLGGAFSKSAQVPLHSWLPNAMEAPTPVSAFLHSATMVKAGVYLVMRMQPVLGDTIAWTTILPVFGGVTLLTGVFLGLRQTDLKLMLAYTTVASLGLLVMLTGTSHPVAIQGAVLYLFAHSLFKGALFMVAGTIDHEAGTRDWTRLRGLRRVMPITFVAAGLAALSMSGIPPFIGFVAKEYIYKGVAGTSPQHIAVVATAVLGNAMMMAIALAVAIKPFLGPKVEAPKPAHEGPSMLWVGPVSLAALGIASALLLSPTVDNLLGPMIHAVEGERTVLDIHLIPSKFDAAVMLSIATILLGLLSFRYYDSLHRATLRWTGWGPDKGFDQIISGLIGFSEVTTAVTQPGRLRTYVTIVFVAVAICLWLPLITLDGLPSVGELPPLNPYEWGIFALAIVGLFAIIVAKNRLTAVISLGIQGFAVALIFLNFGAPDLAFTQLMVETLSVVILALVLTRLSLEETDRRSPSRSLLDGGLAVIVGAGFSAVLIAVVQNPIDLRLSEFFTTYSQPVAHGRNIVNVILVDYRALDTLGEIGVVLVAGLACLALIRIRVRKTSGDPVAPEARLEAAE
ncbi:MAG: putative monovalent cation/H+ antiporter subunit A [Pseudomonadota bacterium]